MWQVVRFNPWFYIAGTLAVGTSAVLLACAWHLLPQMLAWMATIGLFFAIWWLAASLVVSHWVYDRSTWPTGEWLRDVRIGEHVLNVHSGFDETTSRLRQWYPHAEIIPLDLFDPIRLTEKSIHHARAHLPPLPGTLEGTPERWPIPPGSFDSVLFLLSAHEFRSHHERVALLSRARESLRPGGVVVLAEHVRDVANFVAFGPGFMHFHSVKAWTHAWQEAGLTLVHKQRVTPFVRVWLLGTVSTKPSLLDNTIH